MKKRILSLVISLVMLLTPVVSLGEAAVNPYAGVLMPFAAGNCYASGNPINLEVGFGLDSEAVALNEAVAGMASLLDRVGLHVTVYNENGMPRVHAEVMVDPLTLVIADVRVSEDGCIQAMTNLTGNYVLSMPLEALMAAANDTGAKGVSLKDFDLETEEGLAAFHAIPAKDRLAIIGAGTGSQLMKPLMTWMFQVQMDKEVKLCTFDDTLIEASEKRDPVVRRMIGQLRASNLLALFSGVMGALDSSMGEVQLALTEILAEAGVTRQQAQMLGQLLFKMPAAAPENAEGEVPDPIQLEDVVALFEGLKMFMNVLCENATDNVLGLTVSYNDQGAMTGIDVDLQQISAVLPLAGALEYSSKNIESVRLQNAHGELQVAPQNGVIGNLDIKTGWNADGISENLIGGYVDVIDQSSNVSMGAGVNAGLNYSIDTDAAGQGSEMFEGGIVVNARMNGEEMPKFGANIKGQTTVNEAGFNATSNVAVNLGEMGMLLVNVNIGQGEKVSIPFNGFKVVDLSTVDESGMEEVKAEVQAQVMGLGVKLTTMPDMMGDLLSTLTVLTSQK